MSTLTHPGYAVAGAALFLLCIAAMYLVVGWLRRQKGSVPVLFSTHPQELQKLGTFVAMLPDRERRLVRLIAVAGFAFLVAGVWLGMRGL